MVGMVLREAANPPDSGSESTSIMMSTHTSPSEMTRAGRVAGAPSATVSSDGVSADGAGAGESSTPVAATVVVGGGVTDAGAAVPELSSASVVSMISRSALPEIFAVSRRHAVRMSNIVASLPRVPLCPAMTKLYRSCMNIA